MKRYEILMVIDGVEYHYGSDDNKEKAQEIAIKICCERGVETKVIDRK